MKRTPLRRESEQARSNKARRRAVVSAARRRDRNRCVGRDRAPHIRCWGELQPHELVARAHWHNGIYVLDNVIMLCEAHHRWTHDYPDAAHDAGLKLWSWERADPPDAGRVDG